MVFPQASKLSFMLSKFFIYLRSTFNLFVFFQCRVTTIPIFRSCINAMHMHVRFFACAYVCVCGGEGVCTVHACIYVYTLFGNIKQFIWFSDVYFVFIYKILYINSTDKLNYILKTNALQCVIKNYTIIQKIFIWKVIRRYSHMHMNKCVWILHACVQNA